MSDQQPATPAPAAPAQPAQPAVSGVSREPPPQRPSPSAAAAPTAGPTPDPFTELRTSVQQLVQANEQLQRERSQLAERLDLGEVGLKTPDAIAVARALHGLDTSENKPPLAAWVSQHAEAPETAPPGLRAYLAAPATLEPVGTEAAQAAPAQPAPPRPVAVPGTNPAGAPPGTTDPMAQLRDLTNQLRAARQTYGLDHDAVRQLRTKVQEQVARSTTVASLQRRG